MAKSNARPTDSAKLRALRRAEPRVEVRPGLAGQGVFAVRQIRRGQVIGLVTGHIEYGPEFTRSTYGIEMATNVTLDPAPPFRFLNHSCEPNCELFSWLDEEQDCRAEEVPLRVQSLRTIQPGDELTIDYAWPAEMAVPCRCGADSCRGWVVDRNELALVRSRTDTAK